MTFAIWTFAFMGITLFTFSDVEKSNGKLLNSILHGNLFDLCCNPVNKTTYIKLMVSIWWTGALIEAGIWFAIAVMFALFAAAVSSATIGAMIIIAFTSVLLGNYIFSMLFVFVSAIDVSRKISDDNS